MFMTPTPQFLEGVQFSLLGIQGTIARYPLHFHICGDGRRASVIRKNTIINSKQVSIGCSFEVLSPPPSLSLSLLPPHDEVLLNDLQIAEISLASQCRVVLYTTSPLHPPSLPSSSLPPSLSCLPALRGAPRHLQHDGGGERGV